MGLLRGSFVATLIALCVSASSAAAARFDPRPYLHAQHLVDIDGRRLNLYCTGTGSPTVILDAPAGATNKIWYRVQPQVARTTRVCSYDRAGMGFSDPGPFPRDAGAAVSDLHTLLHRAGIASPYVLVGHSIAGLYVRLYSDRYSSEVSGMVLVDPAVPYQTRRLEAVVPAYGRRLASAARQDEACGAAAATGDLKPGTKIFLRCGLDDAAAMRKDCANDGPALCKLDELNNAVWQRPAPWQATASETKSLDGASSKQVRDGQRNYGAMPLIVLTAANTMKDLPLVASNAQKVALWAEWKRLHDEIAALSSVGMNFVIANAGHAIEIDRPTAIISAVDEVVDQTRHPAKQ